MTTLYQALMLILNVVWWIMIAHIIMSWLINFQVLNLRQPLVAQVWDGLNRLLEPLYRPIRSILPDLGGIDDDLPDFDTDLDRHQIVAGVGFRF